LVVVSGPQPAYVLRTDTWKVSQHYDEQDAACVAISPDGKQVAFGIRASPHKVEVRDRLTSKVLWSAEAAAPLLALQFSAVGKELVARRYPKATTQSWDTASGDDLWNQPSVGQWDASPDGRWGFNAAGVFERRTGWIHQAISLPSDSFNLSGAVTPLTLEGRHVVVGSQNGMLLIYRLAPRSSPQAAGPSR
jgi:hypothetical protein